MSPPAPLAVSVASVLEEERQIEQEHVDSIIAGAQAELRDIDQRQDALIARLQGLEDGSRR